MNCFLPLKRVALLTLLFALWNFPARANALLKPTHYSNTQYLRTRALKIEAEIHGAFSRTTVTTTHANPNTQQLEADFIYTAPENATVTGFAYWFKGEKVVARVVEKERAAQIYDLITRPVYKRDPAIIEMIGKNTFRARISPVEARADLQVEVQFIEPLATTQRGWQWSFPLSQETKNYPLDKVQIEARMKIDSIANTNFGDFQNGVLKETKTKVKDAADLKIEIPTPPAPLRVGMYAARDGGSDGFFAIALVPDFSASHPQFAVSGIKTYDVMSDDTARAGQTFVAVGRYRGKGEALVKLGARSVRVVFSDAKIPGNIAALVWGARRIETLSQNERNRAAVINLSKRFNIPSKWTSWLALPASEKKAFESNLIELEMNRAMRNWAQAVAADDANKQKFFRAQAHGYDVRWAKVTGTNPGLSEQNFNAALNEELDRVVQASWYKDANKAQLARYANNLRRRGAKSKVEEEARKNRLQQEKQQRQQKREEVAYKLLAAKGRKWVNAIERGDNASAKRLNREIDAILSGSELSYDPRDSWTQGRLNQIATAIEKERKAGVEDSPRQQELLQKMRVLLPFSKQSEQQILDYSRAAIYAPDLEEAYKKLAAEIKAGREESSRAEELQKRITKLKPLTDSYHVYGDLQVRNNYRDLAAKLATEYASKMDKGATPEELEPIKERARRNFKRFEDSNTGTYKVTNPGTFEELFAYGWTIVASDATEKIASEIAAGRENSLAVQQEQARHERALKMGGRDGYYASEKIKVAWRGRAHETAYRLLQAQQKGDEQTALALEKRLQMEVANAGEVPLDVILEWEKGRIQRGEPLISAADYRLRWGDPLISVRAPESCQKVVAILPSGELLPLVFDAGKGAWEARFDVPTYSTEGEYKVAIIIVGADGARRTLTMFFNVDTTAPTGKGDVRFQSDAFDLRLTSDENTDRVSAFLPWNERVELRRDESGVFGAKVSVPQDWQKRAAVVRFVVTDKAHNRTELEVDWSSER